jgi:rhodanese-related sulfurtransferase
LDFIRISHHFLRRVFRGIEQIIGTQNEDSAENDQVDDGSIARDLTAEEFKKKIGSEMDIQLVDVRTPEEVAEGAIYGALNIDYMADDFESRALELLDKKKPVLVYCKAGGRSAGAMELLSSKGFVEVYNLLGGYSEWPYKEGE